MRKNTGNDASSEGVRALSEALKANTTLQSCNLWSEQEESDNDGSIAGIANNKQQQVDNYIGAEGARELSEALKTNTTLQSLNLRCEQEVRKMDELQTFPTTNTNKQGTRLEMKEQEH